MKWYGKLSLFLVAGAAAYAGLAASGPAGRIPDRAGRPTGARVEKSDAEWRALLGEGAYRVARQKGTERAFTGQHWDRKDDGSYACVGCGQALFDSADKYDSGTGWPSFDRPRNAEAVSLLAEGGFRGGRTEVVCSRCDAHLGHVFPDGPPTTGRRYCMNSAALTFAPRGNGNAGPPPR